MDDGTPRGSDSLGNQFYLCPCCRADLTPSMRTHLYICPIVPNEVRQRAQAVRDMARRLVKESGGLRDYSNVLRIEAEAAIVKLRETIAKAATTERRPTDRGGFRPQK